MLVSLLQMYPDFLLFETLVISCVDELKLFHDLLVTTVREAYFNVG